MTGAVNLVSFEIIVCFFNRESVMGDEVGNLLFIFSSNCVNFYGVELLVTSGGG